MKNNLIFQYDSCVNCIYFNDIRNQPMANKYLSGDFYCRKRNVSMYLQSLMKEQIWCDRVLPEAPETNETKDDTKNTNNTNPPEDDNRGWGNMRSPWGDL